MLTQEWWSDNNRRVRFLWAALAAMALGVVAIPFGGFLLVNLRGDDVFQATEPAEAALREAVTTVLEQTSGDVDESELQGAAERALAPFGAQHVRSAVLLDGQEATAFGVLPVENHRLCVNAYGRTGERIVVESISCQGLLWFLEDGEVAVAEAMGRGLEGAAERAPQTVLYQRALVIADRLEEVLAGTTTTEVLTDPGGLRLRLGIAELLGSENARLSVDHTSEEIGLSMAVDDRESYCILAWMGSQDVHQVWLASPDDGCEVSEALEVAPVGSRARRS